MPILGALEAREVEALVNAYFTIPVPGGKLTGGYALTRISANDEEIWLLVKMADGAADPNADPVGTRPESVLSGRTNEDLAREWRAGRP